jgi:hypothetical protein
MNGFDALNDITGFDTFNFGECFIQYASPKDTHGPVVTT